ncbi:MAG: nuclear transport factor 2 family protein [Frankiales bacterium]|jgi:hypothetical protein|nr:nuclear transport factor 2 family protein [Frankiales bacterium]
MSDASDLRPVPAWARQTGHTRVQRLAAEAQAGAAIDRLLIAERIYRYGWSYDERDQQGLEDCFTEDGSWEGLIMGRDQVGPFVGRATIVEWLMGFWSQQADQRRHIFTNVVIDDLGASIATAHAYLMLTAAAAASVSTETVGPYRLELVKDPDGVWRFSRLLGGYDAPF